MAFTVTQYNAICDAIGTGELVVQYDGKRVQYRSMNELIQARNLIESELVAAGLLTRPSERGGTTFAAYDPN